MTGRARSVGLLSLAVVAMISVRLFAQSPWTEVRGAGFVLRSQIAPDKLTGVACDLETAARALHGPTSGNAVLPQAVAVNDAGSVREWLPQFNERGRGNPLGAYWRGLYGDHIVVRVDAPPAERLRRVLHEYAHFVTHVAQLEPPTWLDEGLSEVWEHAAIAPGTIEIGRPVAEHLKRLRSTKDWIPVAQLLGANGIPTRTDSASAMFYAESWALVHYLMFERRLGQGLVDRVPEQAEMPTDAALKAYVSRPMGPVVIISTAAAGRECPGQTTVQQIPPFELLVKRAQALSDGERPDAALPLVRAARVLSPDSIEVMEVLGFVHFRANRAREAAAVFDDVIETGRGSHISYYYRAVLSAPIPDKTRGGGPIPEVDYLRKALVLNPGFAPAVQRLRELMGKY